MVGASVAGVFRLVVVVVEPSRLETTVIVRRLVQHANLRKLSWRVAGGGRPRSQARLVHTTKQAPHEMVGICGKRNPAVFTT